MTNKTNEDPVKLMGAAPEMARFILEQEFDQETQFGDECAWCCRTKSEGHAENCKWLRVVRKAGLR